MDTKKQSPAPIRGTIVIKGQEIIIGSKAVPSEAPRHSDGDFLRRAGELSGSVDFVFRVDNGGGK
jgi:hypothetical protein